MFHIITLLVLIAPFSVIASEIFPTAHRKENIDYSVYLKKAFSSRIITEKSINGSPLSEAKPYGTTQLAKVTGWKSLQTMQERFEQTRDSRFIEASGGELRRISWMYPDDGCFARAGLFVRNMFHKYAPLPNKVFVFGNLRVNTIFSPRGRVGWWYHTAPIVEVKGQKFVLDPSIELSKPLPLEEWMKRMGDPAKMKIAICGSGTYSPSDSCAKESDGMELRAYKSQLYYLSLEEKRVQGLNLNVTDVLGDNPPW